jgi:hypothetical protein
VDVLTWWHELRLLEFQQSIHQGAGVLSRIVAGSLRFPRVFPSGEPLQALLLLAVPLGSLGSPEKREGVDEKRTFFEERRTTELFAFPMLDMAAGVGVGRVSNAGKIVWSNQIWNRIQSGTQRDW